MNALKPGLAAYVFATQVLDYRDVLHGCREDLQRIEELILSRAEPELVFSTIAERIRKINVVLAYHG